MKDRYKLIKGYQDNDSYRASMIELAKKTFGLDFEGWYQLGYWKENYIPYAIIDGDQVLANVSVSPMKFIHGDRTWNVIQIGTVMTEESYRGQGLSRILMEAIEKDYDGIVDGAFLFANDSVVTFYPKFGYRKEKEYKYSKKVQIDIERTAKQVLINSDESRINLEAAIHASLAQSDLWLSNQMELTMFYVTSFMEDKVYYVESQEAFVISELEGSTLELLGVFASREVDLDQIIQAFGNEVKEVVLGFVPFNKEGFEKEELLKDDSTFFVKGDCFKVMEQDGLRIAELAHT